MGRVQRKVEPKKDPLRRPRAAQTWPAMRSFGPSAAAHAPCSTVPSRWFRHRRHRFGRGWIRGVWHRSQSVIHAKQVTQSGAPQACHSRASGNPERLHRPPHAPIPSRLSAGLPPLREGMNHGIATAHRRCLPSPEWGITHHSPWGIHGRMRGCAATSPTARRRSPMQPHTPDLVI